MDWKDLTNLIDPSVSSIDVSTDTRQLQKDCIFFALHGERFNGNNFAKQALSNGARYVVVDEKHIYDTLPPDKCFLVNNTSLALQSFAHLWRQRFAIPVIAITGTNGKTTTKELTAAILSTQYKVLYTKGNLNNDLGVPLTLLKLTREHEIAIIEMGASHIGDIKNLVNWVEPNYGLITNVGLAHLEYFHDIEGVMATKCELYDYLYEHNGTIFRNSDNTLLTKMDKMAHSHFPKSQAKNIEYQIGPMPSQTNLIGDYNAENIAAASCIGTHFEISQDNIDRAIKNYTPNNMRSELKETNYNKIIVDAYNANPTSMLAAIQSFKGDTFILGKMNELGEFSQREHQNIVNMLLEKKCNNVFLVGNYWRETTAPYPIFDNVDTLIQEVKTHPIRSRYILLKGSRTNYLENLIEYL